MNKKAWWRSKTLWINAVAGAGFIAQSQFGFIIDAEAQAAILAVANLVLRVITQEAVGLQSETAPAPGPFPGIAAGSPGAGQ